jgi:hypothetical protein
VNSIIARCGAERWIANRIGTSSGGAVLSVVPRQTAGARRGVCGVRGLCGLSCDRRCWFDCLDFAALVNRLERDDP